MKRFGNLYQKVWDYENIARAHYNARKGKRHYREVKQIDKDPDKFFEKLQQMLKTKTFRNSAYDIITKKTDSGKIREIYRLPYFPDRIVHHCIVQVMEEIWTKTLIKDTYCCVKGRGIHKGVDRIKSALRDEQNTKDCLKLDVKKYYPSVNNEILKKIIRKKIKDKDLLWLLDEIVDSTQGIPIGNYLSQYFGNLYLSDLDHFIKEKLRIKYYFRYCDDMVILHSSKDYLHKIRKILDDYMEENLKLQIKENWQVFPVDSRGIDFLGYRFFHGYVLLRKAIAIKMKRKISKISRDYKKIRPSQIINSIMSYYGWLKYANCKNLINKYIDSHIFQIVKTTSNKINTKNPLQGVI